MQGKVLAVVVTPPFFKASGGVMAGMELSRSLAKISNYDVAIMSTQEKYEKESGGLSVHHFGCNSRLGKCAGIFPRSLQTISLRSSALTGYITQTKPHLVHFHNPHPAGALWEFAQACINDEIPYVISSHGFVECADPSRWIGTNIIKSSAYHLLVQKPFIKTVVNAKAVLLTSPPEHATADLLDIPQDKRFIVTNGYDSFFREQANSNDLETVRERFGIDNQCPTYLFLGNHTSNKGIDTLLTACHKAKQNWRAIIGGAIRSPVEHDALCKTYNVDALGERVVFTDFLSREELRALYQSVDGFVFPSKADTLPLVILDAMASELPVISTTVGGIPFQVNDETGRLVKPDDSDALAIVLDELAESETLRRRLGAAGLQRVQEHFNWDASARAALDVYNHVIESESLKI